MVDTKWRDCDAEGCNNHTPWDMEDILIDDMVVCSPDCAKQLIESMGHEPERIMLHDPQFAVDRSAIGVDPNVVDIQYTGDETPEELIERYDELMPGDEWRPT